MKVKIKTEFILVLFVVLFFFLVNHLNNRDQVTKEMIDSIYKIKIENRAIGRFGGIEEIYIRDKKEIASICKDLVSLKEKNDLLTKPFEGTILINFIYRDKDGTNQYIEIMSTSIIFKPNNEYFIDSWKGQYVSDEFLARIIKYLEIDETKVVALKEYRKIKNLSKNEK